MANHLITFISGLGHWGYVIIFLGVVLESGVFLGFIIPGEMLVLLGGFLAAQGILDWGDLMIWVCAGAIIGDTIGYEIGQHIGRERVLRLGRWVRLRDTHLQKVEHFFHRHGGKTVFLGRFTAFLRALTPFVAGSSRMKYGRFLVYNAAGGIIWGVGCVLLGYFLGASWRYAGRWVGEAAGIVIALVIAFFFLAWLWRWLNRRHWRLKRWWIKFLRLPWVAMFRQRLGPPLVKLAVRLTPAVYLTLVLVIGTGVIWGAGWAFVEITSHVMSGLGLSGLDLGLNSWLYAHTSAPLTPFFRGVTALGSGPVIGGIVMGLALGLVLSRRWYWLAELLVGVGGGALLNEGLKEIIRRPRPPAAHALAPVSGYSFPSGHTAAATLLYGLLAIFAVQVLKRWKWRTLSVLGAFFLIALIGFSRLYLGAHYLSDVLGAYAEAVAWLAICFTGIETHRRSRDMLRG